MNLSSFGLIACGVLLNTFAQLLLKKGADAFGRFEFSTARMLDALLSYAASPYVLGGLACYVVSVVVWLAALSRVEVSVAYPMLSLGFALNALLAWWLLGEAVTAQRIAGIAIIIVGVTLVARS
ncbi:MAG: EamA family transporter [Burkholderiales bacterium]